MSAQLNPILAGFRLIVRPCIRQDRQWPAKRLSFAPWSKGGGFTLIELLIVVAIIMLLTGIMLPSLGQARSYAQLVLCQHQLRQWGLAFELYATDNDRFYPHIDGLDRNNGPADQFGWVDVLPPLIGEKPWREHALYDRPGVGTFFQCPQASLGNGRYGYNPERDGFFSYAMNSCLELDENCYRAEGDGGQCMPSFLQTDLIVSASRVVLLFDQLLDPNRGYGGSQQDRSAGKY
ncbi:MAG: type II secretion system protein, partial [Planctomycetes bacterium]|nr:type II secretion system protein [Planctomycetota bacterium]